MFRINWLIFRIKYIISKIKFISAILILNKNKNSLISMGDSTDIFLYIAWLAITPFQIFKNWDLLNTCDQPSHVVLLFWIFVMWAFIFSVCVIQCCLKNSMGEEKAMKALGISFLVLLVLNTVLCLLGVYMTS